MHKDYAFKWRNNHDTDGTRKNESLLTISIITKNVKYVEIMKTETFYPMVARVREEITLK